jgi:Cft2 family RNA processing exonuclease
MELFQGLDFNEKFSIGDIDLYLQSAGHILGAASVILTAEGMREHLLRTTEFEVNVVSYKSILTV